MPINNTIAFVCGKTGCGKSFLMNSLIQREYELRRRAGIVILDLHGDHLNVINHPEFRYLRVSGDMVRRYKFDWEGILKKYPYIIIETDKIDQAGYQKLGNDIAAALVEVRDRAFFLEEAHLCFPIHDTIRGGFGILVTTGRKLGIDFYFITQRPSTVNTTAVSQANVRISFVLDDINDLQRMRGHFPPEVDLSSLKRFEFVGYNVFTHKMVKGSTDNVSVVDDLINN